MAPSRSYGIAQAGTLEHVADPPGGAAAGTPGLITVGSFGTHVEMSGSGIVITAETAIGGYSQACDYCRLSDTLFVNAYVESANPWDVHFGACSVADGLVTTEHAHVNQSANFTSHTAGGGAPIFIKRITDTRFVVAYCRRKTSVGSKGIEVAVFDVNPSDGTYTLVGAVLTKDFGTDTDTAFNGFNMCIIDEDMVVVVCRSNTTNNKLTVFPFEIKESSQAAGTAVESSVDVALQTYGPYPCWAANGKLFTCSTRIVEWATNTTAPSVTQGTDHSGGVHASGSQYSPRYLGSGALIQPETGQEDGEVIFPTFHGYFQWPGPSQVPVYQRQNLMAAFNQRWVTNTTDFPSPFDPHQHKYIVCKEDGDWYIGVLVGSYANSTDGIYVIPLNVNFRTGGTVRGAVVDGNTYTPSPNLNYGFGALVFNAGAGLIIFGQETPNILVGYMEIPLTLP